MTFEVLDAAAVRRRIRSPQAIAAIGERLRSPLSPDRPPRTRVPVEHGQLLLMPAEDQKYVGVKVVSLAPGNPVLGLPNVQGVYVLMDAATLTPVAVLDAAELTLVRTAATTAFGVWAMVTKKYNEVVIIGSGPQAVAHAEAIQHTFKMDHVTLVARTPQAAVRAADMLAERDVHARVTTEADLGRADVVICCTSARQPVLALDQLRRDVVVAAIGSHEPDARELPTDLMDEAYVCVESAEVARREAGDVIMAEAELGHPVIDVELADMVREGPVSGRRVLKTVGEAWQDLAVAAVALQ